MIGLAVALLFIVLGATVKYGKMYGLIAGYNTMSAEEKATYNIEGIAHVFWIGMGGMGVLVLIGSIVSLAIDYEYLQPISILVATAIGVPYLLIQANSRKFRK